MTVKEFCERNVSGEDGITLVRVGDDRTLRIVKQKNGIYSFGDLSSDNDDDISEKEILSFVAGELEFSIGDEDVLQSEMKWHPYLIGKIYYSANEECWVSNEI